METSRLVLHRACKNGNAKKVRSLLSNGVRTEEFDKEGNTPLLIACKYMKYDIIKLLVSSGAKTNVPDRGSDPNFHPIHNASREDHSLVISALLEGGDNPNKKAGGLTPLMIACKSNSPNSVRALVSGGADLDILDDNNMTALDIAIKYDHIFCFHPLRFTKRASDIPTLEYIESLSVSNLNIIKNGSAMIHTACKRGDCNTVRNLLRKGANPNITDGDGKSPLFIACEENNFSLVYPLVHAKANPNNLMSNGLNSLHIAIIKGHRLVVKELICSKTANPNERTEKGLTPLMLACKNNRYYSVITLVSDKKTIIYAKNEEGDTAISIAKRNGYDKCVTIINSCEILRAPTPVSF